LLDHAASFTVSYTVDERFSHVSAIALGLDVVVGWKSVLSVAPSLVACHVDPSFFFKGIYMSTSKRASLVAECCSESFVEP